jgi:hypothetical protein
MVNIPVSIGELIDKITILEIKSNFSNSHYIQKELNDLRQIEKTISYDKLLRTELYSVNKKLWDVEDALRIKEKEKDFGMFFIELARDVYFLNDKRAEIKNQINEETHSTYREIKCYKD